jgi:Tol biopolymer transport system component
MTAKTTSFSKMLSVIMLITLWLTGCGNQVTTEPTIGVTPIEVPIPTTTPTSIPEPTNTLVAIKTPTPTLAKVYSASSTPTPTIDSIYQAWHATAIAVKKTERAESEQARNNKATQIAQFPSTCEDIHLYRSGISPDGKWFAATCGYKQNQTLIVQDKKGTEWVLEFKDFLNPDTPEGMMGSLDPIFWSPEGEYLYFVTELGYDGGGDTKCFPGIGVYGLFRLNLEAGSWVTVVSPSNSFPGYKIRFSPTGQRYAYDRRGVRITDLMTGEITQIDVHGVTDLSWSPNGKYLAYSVASCGEWAVQSSSVYVWNVLTNQTQLLMTTEEILLRPEVWIDDSTLRINGEKFVAGDEFYIIYEYNVVQQSLMFTGTATPSP